jgi:hypothetical protein
MNTLNYARPVVRRMPFAWRRRLIAVVVTALVLAAVSATFYLDRKFPAGPPPDPGTTVVVGSPEDFYNMGVAAYRAGDHDRAQACMRRAQEGDYRPVGRPLPSWWLYQIGGPEDIKPNDGSERP